ncbi:hypothetical protein WDU94_005975 [Cyamophila willieti]
MSMETFCGLIFLVIFSRSKYCCLPKRICAANKLICKMTKILMSQQLEKLYNTLLDCFESHSSRQDEIRRFLKNPELKADKYYPTCGINEILLRLIRCLRSFDEYVEYQKYGDLKQKLFFTCLISRPRQHKNYRSVSVKLQHLQINKSEAVEEDVFCSDPQTAYFENLSWLYYELRAALDQ